MEHWLPVPGWPEYEVSCLGRVRRIGVAHGAKQGHILTPWVTMGYHYVALWRANRKFTTPVHRLVALAFLPPPGPGQYQAAHGSGDKLDNRPENLRWATPVENAADRDAQGTGAKGALNPGAKLTADQVHEIRRLRDAGLTLAEIAPRFGISDRSVSDIARGRRWGHLERRP